MATKRSAPEDSKMASTGRTMTAAPPPPPRAHKRRKPNQPPQLQHATTSGRAFKKAHPVNELKSQIRSLRRLLARSADVLPADVRVEKERALRTAEHELAAAERAKRRSEVIGRWHKVRFFERQKATKRLKKARKALAAAATSAEGGASGEERQRLEESVREAETEVNYAVYFPLMKDYVPLFSAERKGAREGAEGEEEQQEEEKGKRHGDPEIWELVKRCMAEGTLKGLREGRLDQIDQVPETPATENGSRTSKRRETREKKHATAKRELEVEMEEDERQNSEDSDNESGGGFFE